MSAWKQMGGLGKRHLEFLVVLVGGEPRTESAPKLVGETVVGKPGKNAAQQVAPQKKDCGLGARPLSLVLNPLRAFRPAGLSHLQRTHRLQESEGIASSLHLGRCHKGPWVHQEFVHVAGEMGSAHPLCLSLPPPPPSLIHRNSETVESEVDRTRVFPLPYYSRTPQNEREIMTEGSGPGVRR